MAQPAAISTPTDSQARLEEILVDVFSELADLFGNPRSHGQIYGLLFASPEPLTMVAISDRLRISKGSASQGLRALENLGAVERNNSQRSATYSAKLELKLLISGFVRQRLLPRLEASQSLLAELPPLLKTLPPGHQADYRLRLDRVTKWHRRALQFLPIAQKFLKAD
jgi:DNA-binding transcriptional regulator GbsR (MarR family)